MAWPGPRGEDDADVISSGSTHPGPLARWTRLTRVQVRVRERARALGGTRLRWAAAVAGAGAVAATVLLTIGFHAVGPPQGAAGRANAAAGLANGATARANGATARAGGVAAGRMPPVSTDPGVSRAGPGGVFALGTADGAGWQLAVQDIADHGSRCVPGVTLNGSDADPVFPGPARLTPVGDPAFLTLGPAEPGVGFAFLRLPAGVSWLWLDPGGIGGDQVGMPPVTVTACGETFRMTGFAYPLAGTLRIHASTPAGDREYTVPKPFSDPHPTPADPQVEGVWQDADTAHAEVAAATVAAGRASGQRWSIRVAFGNAGDCFTLSTSYRDDSVNAQPSRNSFCGPVAAPRGRATIMALPIGLTAPGAPPGGGLGVGYAVSVGAGTARLSAELSTGAGLSVTPVEVDGRRYAAFFVAAPAYLTRLSGVDAAGRDVASARDLPEVDYAQLPL